MIPKISFAGIAYKAGSERNLDIVRTRQSSPELCQQVSSALDKTIEHFDNISGSKRTVVLEAKKELGRKKDTWMSVSICENGELIAWSPIYYGRRTNPQYTLGHIQKLKDRFDNNFDPQEA